MQHRQRIRTLLNDEEGVWIAAVVAIEIVAPEYVGRHRIPLTSLHRTHCGRGIPCF